MFDEESMLHQRVETELTTTDLDRIGEDNQKVETNEEPKVIENDSKTYQRAYNSLKLNDYQLTKDRDRRVINLPKRYGIADMISYAISVAEELIGEELINYKQAMSSKDREKWLGAMKEEIISLKKNNTWILVKKPQDKRSV